MTGRVHSLQSLGAVDGPGVRYVVFMQGCPLRCACCHNPDSWSFEGGAEYTPEQIVEKMLHFREYFGDDGGITVSGGEPLAQADFVSEVFSLSRENGVNTCLDTSGCIMSESVERLLDNTDRVLLDIKYTNADGYEKYVGTQYGKVISFLEYLDLHCIPTTLRQVIIPTLNDGEGNLKRLSAIAKKYNCVDSVELLPFRKICQMKYDKLGIKFPLAHIPEPDNKTMEKLNKLL